MYTHKLETWEHKEKEIEGGQHKSSQDILHVNHVWMTAPQVKQESDIYQSRNKYLYVEKIK